MQSTPLRPQCLPATREFCSASLCPLFCNGLNRHKCTPGNCPGWSPGLDAAKGSTAIPAVCESVSKYQSAMTTLPDLRSIREARNLLDPYLPVTRTIAADSLSRGGMEVHLKLETELPTGTFKPRGALYALAVNFARRRVEEVT